MGNIMTNLLVGQYDEDRSARTCGKDSENFLDIWMTTSLSLSGGSKRPQGLVQVSLLNRDLNFDSCLRANRQSGAMESEEAEPPIPDSPQFGLRLADLSAKVIEYPFSETFQASYHRWEDTPSAPRSGATGPRAGIGS